MLDPLPVTVRVFKAVIAKEVHAVLTPHERRPLLALRANALFYEDSRVVHPMSCTVRSNHAVVAEHVVTGGAGDLGGRSVIDLSYVVVIAST